MFCITFLVRAFKYFLNIVTTMVIGVSKNEVGAISVMTMGVGVLFIIILNNEVYFTMYFKYSIFVVWK